MAWHLITHSRSEVIRSRREGKCGVMCPRHPETLISSVCFIFDLKRRRFSTHEKFVSRRNEKITEPQMGLNKFTFF